MQSEIVISNLLILTPLKMLDNGFIYFLVCQPELPDGKQFLEFCERALGECWKGSHQKAVDFATESQPNASRSLSSFFIAMCNDDFQLGKKRIQQTNDIPNESQS